MKRRAVVWFHVVGGLILIGCAAMVQPYHCGTLFIAVVGIAMVFDGLKSQ